MILSLGDYRKWESGRTEPIRHDAEYVRLVSSKCPNRFIIFIADATIGSILR
jgi:hypothetical protein